MKDPTREAKVGDILFGKNNINKNKIRSHYIIYLNNYPERPDLFLGAMLTHFHGQGNFALQPRHFKDLDEWGQKFKVNYDKSFVSPNLYFKKLEWGPFTKEGELSEEGIKFINAKIGDNIPMYSPLNK